MNRVFRCAAPVLALFAASALQAQDARAATDAQPGSAPATRVAQPAPGAVHAVNSTHEAPALERARHGPTLASAAAGVRAGREAPVPTPPKPLPPTRQNEAMMIVGGAGLIVGAIIGDDAGTLIMVGSGILGLFGLYKYLE